MLCTQGLNSPPWLNLIKKRVKWICSTTKTRIPCPGVLLEMFGLMQTHYIGPQQPFDIIFQYVWVKVPWKTYPLPFKGPWIPHNLPSNWKFWPRCSNCWPFALCRSLPWPSLHKCTVPPGLGRIACHKYLERGFAYGVRRASSVHMSRAAAPAAAV